MIRTFLLAAALTAGLALPALAGDQPTAEPAEFTAGLTRAAHANAARQILIARGYTQVSDLTRGEDGRWTGTAMKDGRIVMVGVELPVNASPAATN